MSPTYSDCKRFESTYTKYLRLQKALVFICPALLQLAPSKDNPPRHTDLIASQTQEQNLIRASTFHGTMSSFLSLVTPLLPLPLHLLRNALPAVGSFFVSNNIALGLPPCKFKHDMSAFVGSPVLVAMFRYTLTTSSICACADPPFVSSTRNPFFSLLPGLP